MQLAHEVATRARRTIQNWNNKLRLKEIEAALQQENRKRLMKILKMMVLA